MIKSIKNNRTAFLAIILVGLLIFAYKTIFITIESNLITEENVTASVRVENILQQVEKINFDTSVMTESKFKSLRDLSTPLISLPVGRRNPFSAN